MHEIANDLLLWITIVGSLAGFLTIFRKPWGNWFDWRVRRAIDPMIDKETDNIMSCVRNACDSAARAEHAAARAEEASRRTLEVALEIKHRESGT